MHTRWLREAFDNVHIIEDLSDYELNKQVFNVSFNGDNSNEVSVKGLENVFSTIEKHLGYDLSFKNKDEITSSLLRDEEAHDEDNEFFIKCVDENTENEKPEDEEEIDDLSVYNQRMAAGMSDKLFFLDKVPGANTIVDFGCADGELLKLIPDSWNKVGIDNNSQMIKAAKANCPDASYYSSLGDVDNADSAVLNLSSVIHEIYSYLSKGEINNFWNGVFNSGYKYISIRDMMVSESTNRPWDPEGARKAARHPLFNDFRKHFPLQRERDLIHFLLKYRYVENWARESRENYFPITLEQLKSLIPSKYKITYEDHFILPWTQKKALEDIGYKIKDNTHIKLVLELK